MDYNQDNQYISANNDQSQNMEKPDKFAVASMILGFVSILLCCTGVLSIPFGALGILFAVLTKRLGKGMSSFSITGLVLSSIGMALGLILTVYAVYLILYDPTYREIYNQYYEQFYPSYQMESL